MATTANCEAIQEQVIALADGELDAVASDVVRAHLAECADCRSLLADIEQMRTALPAWKVDEKSVQERLEYEIQQAQAASQGTPFIDLAKHTPEESALRSLPADLALLYRALPMKKDRQWLWVAMAEPHDVTAVDAIRMATRCMVQPMSADLNDLTQAIAAAYSPAPLQAENVSASPSEIHLLLEEMRAMRQEIAALRAEITELRREQREASARYSAPAVRTSDFLMPYAEPHEVPLHLLS